MRDTPDDPFDHAAHLLAHREFRRRLLALNEAHDALLKSLARLVRDDHPLGPVDARELPARNEFERESGRRNGE